MKHIKVKATSQSFMKFILLIRKQGKKRKQLEKQYGFGSRKSTLDLHLQFFLKLGTFKKQQVS